jgi:hypothetical protein
MWLICPHERRKTLVICRANIRLGVTGDPPMHYIPSSANWSSWSRVAAGVHPAAGTRTLGW